MIASAVVHLLATELSNYRHTVRSTAKRAIELMAAAKGCSTTDILAPCREAVETHIFSKQLRAVQVCLGVYVLSRRGPRVARCVPSLDVLDVVGRHAAHVPGRSG